MANKYAVGETYAVGWSLSSGGATDPGYTPATGEALYFDDNSSAMMTVDEAPAADIGAIHRDTFDAETESVKTLALEGHSFTLTETLNIRGMKFTGTGNVTTAGVAGDVADCDFSEWDGYIIYTGAILTSLMTFAAGNQPNVEVHSSGTVTVDSEWDVADFALTLGTFDQSSVFTARTLNVTAGTFAGSGDVEVAGNILLAVGGAWTNTGDLIQTATGTFVVGVALASARISNGAVSTFSATAAVTLLTVDAGCVCDLGVVGDNVQGMTNSGIATLAANQTGGVLAGTIHAPAGRTMDDTDGILTIGTDSEILAFGALTVNNTGANGITIDGAAVIRRTGPASVLTLTGTLTGLTTSPFVTGKAQRVRAA